MSFPTGTPSYAGFTAGHTLSADSHASQSNAEQADIVALANKVGTGNSTPTTQKLLRGNGTGTSAWAQADLTTDVTGVLPIANGGTNATTAAAARTNLGINTQLEILAVVYPVGCIYTTTNSTNPASILGFGTWAAFGAGRVIVGVGTSDQAFAGGITGGESNHTLSTAEMPSHTHGTSSIYNNSDVPTTGANNGLRLNATANQNTVLDNTGGGGSHNNLQPYIVAYYWQRTA
jgi:hypothetical protein